LAGTFYAFMSVSILRDADQQYRAGEVIEKPEPGDLVFFGEPDEDGDVHISHVGISFGGDEFIHSTGAAWGTTINTFAPNGKCYRKWLHENYRGARRFR
jgi:cell wall-associated NlpC family hydrolase